MGDLSRLVLLRNAVLVLAVAVPVFLLTYSNGGFSATTIAYAAVPVWWLLGGCAALGLGAARARVGRLALAAFALLAAFAVWILISIAWAPDAGRALAQFDVVSLYVAVLAIGIAAARVVPAATLVGGLALALSGIAGVALVSRVFPSTFGAAAGAGLLPSLTVRLSFPLGYWNGLGIDVALAYPLLLATMASRRSRLVQALAAFPLPIVAADMYLTSSRGAFVTAGVAVVAYLLLAPNRWTALAATVVAGAAAAVSVAVLQPRRALVDGQTTATGVHQGHVAALAIGLACVGAAVVWLGLGELGKRLPAPPRALGWATAAMLVALGVAALAAAHPVARFHDFKHLQNVTGSGTYVENHLLSTSGSGRWQFWSTAVSQFRAHPLNGGGAGSFEFWWLQHRPFGAFTQFAHSLYLETLGELGIVGLLLLAGAVLLAVVGSARAARALGSGEIAGATACGIAFFVAASFDWVWQLAGIGVVGVGALGIALGALPSGRASVWERFGVVRPALALVAVAAIVPQVVVLVSGLHLRNSQAAFASGDVPKATREALAAKAVEPWAASSYTQLGRIAQAEGHLAEARMWLGEAIARSDRDWSLWLIAAQIDTRRGAIEAARQELARARVLDPIDVERVSRR